MNLNPCGSREENKQSRGWGGGTQQSAALVCNEAKSLTLDRHMGTPVCVDALILMLSAGSGEGGRGVGGKEVGERNKMPKVGTIIRIN